MTLLYFLLYFNCSQNYDTVKILNSVFLLYLDTSTVGGKIQIFPITYVNFLDSHQRIPWLSKGWTPLWGGISGGFMTHNGRTHSHMVTVLPRPERHSTVIPRPVPPRWTRKKRTRKATVPPFPQTSDRSAHNSTWHNQGLFTSPLLGRKRHLTARRSSPRAHEPDVSVLRTCSLWVLQVFPALRTIQPDIPQRGPVLLHRRCCLRRPHQGQTPLQSPCAAPRTTDLANCVIEQSTWACSCTCLTSSVESTTTEGTLKPCSCDSSQWLSGKQKEPCGGSPVPWAGLSVRTFPPSDRTLARKVLVSCLRKLRSRSKTHDSFLFVRVQKWKI